MARLDLRHPGNTAGSWYVDSRCIDCGTCRELAPDLFGVTVDQSIVSAQPHNPGGEHLAWLASDACPTRSIGRSPRGEKPFDLFPLQVDGPVYDLGHTAESSFGATSYLIRRQAGNLMVDSPRFKRPLAEAVERVGGVARLLLTHRDDVADAGRWAAHFGAEVWIHADDASAAPFADRLIEGADPVRVAEGVVAVPVPGHTRGSVVYVADDRWAFTGDSLAWSHEQKDLTAFRRACWYSWTEQASSLDRLSRLARFEWVLPGHGARAHRPADEMHARLQALVGRMGSTG